MIVFTTALALTVSVAGSWRSETSAHESVDRRGDDGVADGQVTWGRVTIRRCLLRGRVRAAQRSARLLEADRLEDTARIIPRPPHRAR